MPLSASGGEAQLLPAGEFAARDGRPGPGKTWKLTDAQGQSLAAALTAASEQTAFLFDYEHQTLAAEKNGQPAPAAGWATKFEWRPGQGLWATDVQWTAAAKQRIDGDEYRYISPVIVFDKVTGAVRSVQMAALVNYPAITGMEAVTAALSAQLSLTDPEPDLMDKAALIALLGLTAAATDADITAAIEALKNKPPALPPELLKDLGLTGTPDAKTVATAVTALKAKATGTDATTLQTVAALQGQVAALTEQVNGNQLADLVEGALKAGKLLPAQKDWATNLGKTDLAALRSYIDSAPVIAAGLQESQTSGKEPKADPNAPLSDTEQAVCKAMGLTAEQFKAATPAA